MISRIFKNTSAPLNVRHASALILSYAAIVFISTLWLGLETEFTLTKDLVRGLVRTAGMTFIAFWLLKLDKTAWWFATIACSFFAILGTLTIITAAVAGFLYDSSLFQVLLRLILPTYFLTHSAYILFNKETRLAFAANPYTEENFRQDGRE